MRPPVRPRRVALEARPAAPRTPAPRPAVRPSTATPAPARAGDRAEPPVESSPPGSSVERPVTAVRPWAPARPPVVSQGSAARFAERVAMRRRLVRRKVAVVASVAVALAALAWLLLVSPVLALDAGEVQVSGEGTVVDAEAVRAVVTRHTGTPLPRLDTVALRREVLDVPGVRAAEVARDWPHGLRVTVVSREPVAAVPQTEGAGFALLDMDGIQVGRVDAAPEGLPVISVPLDDPGARAMTAVLTVLQQLPPELALEVAEAAAQTQDPVRLTLRDGAAVEWGSADQGALKARVLTTLRTAEASAGSAVYDVSAPTLPITRS